MRSLDLFYDESPTKRKTRKSIVEKAFKLMSKRGIYAVTMGEIADTCSITSRNLYRYYGNKDRLAIDLAYYALREIDMYRDVFIEELMTGYEQVKRVLSYLYSDVYDEPNGLDFSKYIQYFDLYIDEMDKDSEAFILYTKVYVKEMNSDMHQILINALYKGCEDGSVNIRKDDIERTAEYIIQSLFALIVRVNLKVNENPAINKSLVNKHLEIIQKHLKATNKKGD